MALGYLTKLEEKTLLDTRMQSVTNGCLSGLNVHSMGVLHVLFYYFSIEYINVKHYTLVYKKKCPNRTPQNIPGVPTPSVAEDC